MATDDDELGAVYAAPALGAYSSGGGSSAPSIFIATYEDAEGDGDIALGHLTDQKGRQYRRIGKRFIIEIAELGYGVEHIGLVEVKFCVASSEVLGDGLGVFRFVETWIVETDRECSHRLAGLLGHKGADQGGVEAAG